MKTRPYHPSNSDAFIIFDSKWCSRCQRDAAWQKEQLLPEAERGAAIAEGGCQILMAAMCFTDDDPRYPVEWIEDDVEWRTPSNPRCTAFRPIDDEDDVADPRQGDLFEHGTKDYRLITFVSGVRRRR
jgi:hypothetical protein